jgi:outer membrane murein-binding lipoprotein Lpp
MKKLMILTMIPAVVAMLLLSGCGKDTVDTALEFSDAGQIEQAIEILDQECMSSDKVDRVLLKVKTQFV